MIKFARTKYDACLRIYIRCLIPDFDGAIFSLEWKEALWDRFYTV